MKNSRLLAMLSIGVMYFISVSSANASLIGDSVDYNRWNDGANWSQQTAVVGAGVEFNDMHLNFDIGANSIRLESAFPENVISVTPNTGSPNQYLEWSSLDWVGNLSTTITGVSVIFANISGSSPVYGSFSANSITFDDHSVQMDVGGITFNEGAYVEITLLTSAVPVPAAAWLFGSGLLGLIGIARRKVRA